MARVVYSEAAEADTIEILAYLCREAGAAVALKYDHKLEDLYDRLEDFPGIGAPRPELGDRRRIMTVMPYVVIYDYDREEDTVLILRVVHGRRKITADLIRG